MQPPPSSDRLRLSDASSPAGVTMAADEGVAAFWPAASGVDSLAGCCASSGCAPGQTAAAAAAAAGGGWLAKAASSAAVGLLGVALVGGVWLPSRVDSASSTFALSGLMRLGFLSPAHRLLWPQSVQRSQLSKCCPRGHP